MSRAVVAEGGTFSTVLSFTSTSAGTQKHRPSVSASKRCPSFRCAKHTLFTLYKKEPHGRRQTYTHTHKSSPQGGERKRCAKRTVSVADTSPPPKNRKLKLLKTLGQFVLRLTAEHRLSSPSALSRTFRPGQERTHRNRARTAVHL